MKAVGHSLYEEMLYDEAGRCLNPNFLDYKIPSIYAKSPTISTSTSCPSRTRSGPFGGKSISEISLNGAAPGHRDSHPRRRRRLGPGMALHAGKGASKL